MTAAEIAQDVVAKYVSRGQCNKINAIKDVRDRMSLVGLGASLKEAKEAVELYWDAAWRDGEVNSEDVKLLAVVTNLSRVLIGPKGADHAQKVLAAKTAVLDALLAPPEGWERQARGDYHCIRDRVRYDVEQQNVRLWRSFVTTRERAEGDCWTDENNPTVCTPIGEFYPNSINAIAAAEAHRSNS